MDAGKKMFFGGTKFEPDDIAKSLRLCVKAGEGNSAACLECALHGRQFEVDCITEMGIQAAKMIESLAAENADLIGDLLVANAELLDLREKVRWIPMGERPPTKDDANDDGEILAVWIGEKVMNPTPAICSGTCAQPWEYVVQHQTWFSHWMPMPEPQKEG